MNKSLNNLLVIGVIAILFCAIMASIIPTVTADLSDEWWESGSDLTPDTAYDDNYLDWNDRDQWETQIGQQFKRPDIISPASWYVPIGCTYQSHTYGTSKVILYYSDTYDKYALAWDLVRGEDYDGYDHYTWTLFTQVYYIEPSDSSYSDYDLIAYHAGEVNAKGNFLFDPIDNSKSDFIKGILLYQLDEGIIDGDQADIDSTMTIAEDATGEIKWEIFVNYCSYKKVAQEEDDWYDWIVDGVSFVLNVITTAYNLVGTALIYYSCMPVGGTAVGIAITMAALGAAIINELCQSDNQDKVVWKEKNTGIVRGGNYKLGFNPSIVCETDIKETGYDTSDAYENQQGKPFDTGRCYNTINAQRFKDIFVEIKVPDPLVPTQSKMIPYITEFTNFPKYWQTAYVTRTEHKIEFDLTRDQYTDSDIDDLIEGGHTGYAYWLFNIDPMVDFETSNPLSGDPEPDDIICEAEFDPVTDDYFYKIVDTVDMVESTFSELTGYSTSEDISAKLVEIYDSSSELVCVYPNNYMGDTIFKGLTVNDDIAYNGNTYEGTYYFSSDTTIGPGKKQKISCDGTLNGLFGTSVNHYASDWFVVEYEGKPRIQDELPWTVSIELEHVVENLQKDDWYSGNPMIDDITFEVALNPEVVDLDKTQIAVNVDELFIEVGIEGVDTSIAEWSVSNGNWKAYIWSKDADTFYDLIGTITVNPAIYQFIPSYVYELDDGNGVYGMELKADKPDDDYPRLGAITLVNLQNPPPGSMYLSTDNEIVINIDQQNEKITVQKYIDSTKEFDIERCIEFPVYIEEFGTTPPAISPSNFKPSGDLKIRVDTTRDHTVNILDEKDQLTIIFDVQLVRLSCVTTSGQIYVVNTDFLVGIVTPAQLTELYEEFFYNIET